MKYKTAPGVILASVCEKYFLVTARETIQVNETAAFCWKQLEPGIALEELCAAVGNHYETADFDSLKDDIQKLVSSMSGKQLLIRCDT